MENEKSTPYCHALYLLENSLHSAQPIGPDNEVFIQAKRDVLAAIARIRRDHSEIVINHGDSLSS